MNMLKGIMICSPIFHRKEKRLNLSAKLFIANYSLNSNYVFYYLSDLVREQQKDKELYKEVK